VDGGVLADRILGRQGNLSVREAVEQTSAVHVSGYTYFVR
jgi:hypothetical protein